MKNVVVFGETSYIGKHLAERLSDSGLRVVALNNPHSQKSERENDGEISVDILNPRKNGEYLELLNTRTRGQIDCIYVFSWAGTKNRNSTDLNRKSADGLFSILDSILHHFYVKKIVQIGSQAEYGRVSGIVTEKTICMPNTEYGKYKLLFAQSMADRCQDSNVEFLDIRLHSVYGYGCRNLIGRVLEQLLNGHTVHMDTDCTQKWNYLYIEDCVEALWQAMITARGGIYNVGNDEGMTLRDYLDIVRKVVMSSAKVAYGNKYETKGPDFTVDSSKFYAETGWKPRIAFKEGIEKMLIERDLNI